MDIAIPLLIVLVLGVACALWWQRRRDTRPAPPSAAPAQADAQDTPTPAAPSSLPPPALRPLIRRMYAAVMHAPELIDPATPIGGIQAQILSEAAAELAQLDVRPKNIPRRPHLLPQLMRAVNDPDISNHQIAAVIAQDPALAASLLRIANSALYRPRDGHAVDSIERGVAQIGTDGVRQIVVAALMQPVLSLDSGLFARLPAAIWDYALRTAVAAAHHAQRNGTLDDALHAQLLGLLQGLGAVIVMRVLSETYARHPGVPKELVTAAALLDRHVTPTSRTVAVGWELPPTLAEALTDQRAERDHTVPTTALGKALRYGRLAAVLTMLVRSDDETEDNALAMLATLEPDEDANRQLWERLSSHSATP